MTACPPLFTWTCSTRTYWWPHSDALTKSLDIVPSASFSRRHQFSVSPLGGYVAATKASARVSYTRCTRTGRWRTGRSATGVGILSRLLVILLPRSWRTTERATSATSVLSVRLLERQSGPDAAMRLLRSTASLLAISLARIHPTHCPAHLHLPCATPRPAPPLLRGWARMDRTCAAPD